MNIDLPWDADHLATSWLSAFAASSNDDERPLLYRSVAVEVHEHGVRFTSTDSYVLSTVWAPLVDKNSDEPDPGVAPVERLLIADPDKRCAQFMGYVRKLAVAAKKDDSPFPMPEVTAEVHKARPDSQLQLFAEDRREFQFILNGGDEAVTLPVLNYDFPEWRRILHPSGDPVEFGSVGDQQQDMGLTAHTLKIMSRIASLQDPNRLVAEPRDSTVMFRTESMFGEPVVSGAFALVRGYAAPDTE